MKIITRALPSLPQALILIFLGFIWTLSSSKISPKVAEFPQMENSAKISLASHPQHSIESCALRAKVFYSFFELASESVCKWVSSCVCCGCSCVYVCVDAIKSNFILRRVNPLDRSLKYRTNKFRMCAFPPRRSDVQFMPKNLRGMGLNLCEGVDVVSLLVPVQMVP